MKLIPWQLFNDIEAYTTCAYDEQHQLMNMSFNGEDDQLVLKNRKKLATELNTDLQHMVATFQQHTTQFLKVSLKDGGKGMYSRDDAFIGYDAMYTRDENLWLWTFHADCCPVLLYCQDQKIVAAIHSGWKGTVGEIVGKVTKHLIENENCQPEHIYAYIGPSIEQKNFEAKDDIIKLVQKMSFETSPFYIKKDDGNYLLDSKGLIQQQLLNLKIPIQHITVSPYCTIENNDLFFSYRKTKTKYRNITLIRLKSHS
ncbi:peptidoglycan editing factor PgeF [Candidatus Stoquefichus massiliensis]|uniref:peptidoglycan editing factor PgeF n=1 Tax=Candidatus Stoquefichus massiliensis TaxID=1470350 RepID=UPI000480B5A8|nr:peptidoglycan editing factor PgeF [Candidatus Stoquefichus massiliensis]